MPLPLDVTNDIFRDIPHVRDLTAEGPPGPTTRADRDDGVGNLTQAFVWQPTTQDVIAAHKEQDSPTPLRVHAPIAYVVPPHVPCFTPALLPAAPVQTMGMAAAAVPTRVPAGGGARAGAAVPAAHVAAVQRGVDQGPAAATTPVSPATALAGLSLQQAAAATGSSTGDTSAPGLVLLADTAVDYLETIAPHSPMMEDVRPERTEPARTEKPAIARLRDPLLHLDRPIPGVLIDHDELLRQQQALVSHQLAHDEARACSNVVLNPKAQYYSFNMPSGPLVDPMALRDYAPMEVDGVPYPRERLAHANVTGSGSDASDSELYPPAPLEPNLPDDPPGAYQVPHRFTGEEQQGMRLLTGERRYFHDVPIRNSSAISTAIQGASANIPQVWTIPDVVHDARHLAGGHAAPPQPAILSTQANVFQFMAIPATGIPAMHFDDPETLLKGLAAERIHVIFRQPQCSMVLTRVYNGGVPRAHNVKQQSDALAEAITAITNATDFIVVPPAQSWNSELSHQDQPETWAVLRLDATQVRALVRQALWSSHKITFMAFNRDIRFGRFIGRIGYYTHNADQDIENSIKRTFAGPLVLPSIRSLVASHPNMTPVEVEPAVERVLDSLRVKVITYPNGNIIANVYCDSPTFAVESWRTWVAYVRTVPFWSDLNPTGTFLRTIRCAGCSGADHPSFMCPYPLLPGWNGPEPGAASIEGPTNQPGPPGPALNGRGGQHGTHPYRGGSFRGRRGRGRASPV
ncbi:hypothetical protein C8T65DRAFT_735284 [Cerioporus squamosus]|nr:hypothetical protein C8T65DRAFT_735284 [Cerioporus squamosus]